MAQWYKISFTVTAISNLNESINVYCIVYVPYVNFPHHPIVASSSSGAGHRGQIQIHTRRRDGGALGGGGGGGAEAGAEERSGFSPSSHFFPRVDGIRAL
jgi:hypothetical protein